MMAPAVRWELALLLLLCCTMCHGATYLGCFKTAGWTIFSEDNIGSWSMHDCDLICNTGQMPLMALAGIGNCICAAMVPTAQVSDDQCKSKAEGVAAVYYRHQDSRHGCRLAPIPMTASAWDIPSWSVDRLRWGGRDMVELGMFKTDGSRINSKDAYAFGMSSIRAKVDPNVGVVTAFYLTSDLQNLRTDMHEIDFEFINGDPATSPGCLWTNVYMDGKTQKERLITPNDLKARTGNQNFQTFTDFHTYTLDWQPTYIRWYVDGMMVDERSASQYHIPWKPQYLHLSLWTQTGWGWWGGTFDPNHSEPFWSQFTQAQRVVCDLPAPRTLDIGAPATLPAAPSPSPNAKRQRPPKGSGKRRRPAPNGTTPSTSPSPGSAPTFPATAGTAWSMTNEYLGCFMRTGMAGTTAYLAGEGKPTSSEVCRKYCGDYKLPVYMLDNKMQCMCGAFIPNAGHQDNDEPCKNGAKTHLMIYYKFDTGNQRVQISNLPFEANSWDIPDWAAKLSYLVPEQGKLALQMDGFNGSRATSKDFRLYGLYSVSVQPDSSPGAVTQLALTNDAAGGGRKNSEIVINFINGQPATDKGAVSIAAFYHGSFQVGTMLEATELQHTMGASFSTYAKAHTWTIDWQPGHLRIYIDGVPLQEFQHDDTFKMPDAAATLALSFWTATNTDGYGGAIKKSHPAIYANFFNVRRVIVG